MVYSDMFVEASGKIAVLWGLTGGFLKRHPDYSTFKEGQTGTSV